MSLTRFFCREIADDCRIEGSEAHHISNVMRMKAGDKVELFDGNGKLAVAEITKAGKREILLTTQSISAVEKRKSGRIILVVSVAKDQRFDWMIAKATELGIDHICPAMYHRTVKQGSGKNIVERYQKIAVSSAKQCKRLHLPIIEKPANFTLHLEMLKKVYPENELIISSLSEGSISLLKTDILNSAKDKIVFIGPEGGFTEDEETWLCKENANKVRLTETVLRIETAAVAIASVLAIARN